MKVFIQAYEAEVEVPVIVVSGPDIKRVVRLFEAIGYNSNMALTVAHEEEIEMLGGQWGLFYCDKFDPREEFTNKHTDYKFIHIRSSAVSEVFWIKDNFLLLNNARPSIIQTQIARFTGLNAFSGLMYDEMSQLWVNRGKASEQKDHTTQELATRFSKEMAKWVAAGRPMRSLEVIDALFDTFCIRCSDFIAGKSPERGKCNLCGCHINTVQTMLNKLAMSTTSCPKELWTADVAVSDKAIKGRETELRQQFIQIQQAEFGPQDGSMCDCQD